MHHYYLCKQLCYGYKVKDLFIFIPYFPDIFSFLFLEFLAYTFFLLSGELLKLFQGHILCFVSENLHTSFILKVLIYIILFDEDSVGYIFLDVGLNFRIVFSPMTLG